MMLNNLKLMDSEEWKTYREKHTNRHASQGDKSATDKQLELLMKLDRKVSIEDLKRLTRSEASQRIEEIFKILDRNR